MKNMKFGDYTLDMSKIAFPNNSYTYNFRDADEVLEAFNLVSEMEPSFHVRYAQRVKDGADPSKTMIELLRRPWYEYTKKSKKKEAAAEKRAAIYAQKRAATFARVRQSHEELCAAFDDTDLEAMDSGELANLSRRYSNLGTRLRAMATRLERRELEAQAREDDEDEGYF